MRLAAGRCHARGMTTASLAAHGAALQWGDVASWVGSLATSVALLLTYGLLRVTRNDQRTLWADQRISQARKVSAWCEKAEPAATQGQPATVIRLQNASDEPIYGARVAVADDWFRPASGYTELDVSYVIPPNYNRAYPVNPPADPAVQAGKEVALPAELGLPVEIIFSDAGGRFWHRDRYGGLTEITKGLPPSASDHFFTAPKNKL